jgi:hypothetical protein
MTLAETLPQSLAKWRPFSTGRQSFAEPDVNGWSLELTAERNDSVGTLLWDVTLTRNEGTPAPAASDWAAAIAARATGLLEPLTVHEVDAGRGEAVLRSSRPARRGNQLFWYEVRLFGGDRAVLRRFQSSHSPGNRPQAVAFALTHEAIAKLAADLLPA